MLCMETPSNENSEHSITPSNDAVPNEDNIVPEATNHGGVELECEFAEEEVKGILEVIASTGKFWHGWYKLKNMLSFQLKQVLSEYAEAKMTTEQQNASLGETYLELVKRLDEALLSFVEGPPFTLQRLSEILLEGRSIYPNLSKLALALEKNLLVTSMLTISTDPYPQSVMPKADEAAEKASEEPEPHPNSVQNGVEAVVVGDRDEVMTDVEEAEIDDEMTIDMEAFEEIVGSSEPKSEPAADS
ncbi:uncharacterized protein LOC132167961 [Corylus avellana]|uniref:uncharacterized protein LOC132167961 n=1 Tax=Corylus avellana TaxID=13451 RepID=UPI00286B7BA1|nr:uncharacterized protein LOC132167961 [Corylus avellana]